MKLKNKFTLLVLISMLYVSQVFAQPGILIADTSGSLGTVVPVTAKYLGDGTDSALNFDLVYDETKLTPSNCVGSNLTTTTATTTVTLCSFIAPNIVRVLIQNFSGGNIVGQAAGSEETIITVDFTIGAAVALGDSALTLSSVNFAPSGADGSATGNSTPVVEIILEGPIYTSDVVSGTDLTFATGVIAGGTGPSDSIDITNTGTAGTTLTGSCALSGADAGSYSITPAGGAFSVDDGAAAATISVACDASTDGTFVASLDCTHNENGDTEAYALSCTIDPPLPTYTADSTALTFAPLVETTAPASTGTLDLTNTGDAGSQLAGTCSITNEVGGSAFSVTGGAMFDIATSDSAHVVTVECSTAAFGTYTADLSCAHNDAVTGSPTVQAMSCEVTEPGAAAFVSLPVAGAINMTPSGDVVQNSASPTFDVVISNGTDDVTANSLDLVACSMTAGSITASSDPLTVSIDADGGTSFQLVTFTCPTTSAGPQTGTYTCPYSTNGTVGNEGTAVYDITCGVRAAESAGSPTVDQNLRITAPPGGSSSGSIPISELNGEGEDLTGVSCSLDAAATTAGFTITTDPTATIASGTSSSVVITLTDGGVSPLTGTATCNYTDSSGAGSFDISLTGVIRAIIVPTMSTIGYIAMMFGLLLVGFFGIRRRA